LGTSTAFTATGYKRRSAYKDWVTGEETSVNLSQFHTPVEAAKSFFEKAKKTEKTAPER